MSEGFYKRRRGVLEHLESGKISLLDLAVHDYLSLKANLVVGSQCGLPPGVCITSAAAIHVTCPKQISERAVQRSLEHLEEIGWIKRWNVRGKRGNYPTLVCRSSVHDLSGTEYRVNGEATTDWKNPVLVRVGELSSVCPEADAKLSGDREVRRERGEKAALRRSPFWEAIGVKPETLPAALVELCEGLYPLRGDQSLFEFLGACMDAWQAQGQKIPPALARAKARLRVAARPEDPSPFPVAEVEEWGPAVSHQVGAR